MLTDPLRWVEVDLGAIQSNVHTLRSLTNERTAFCAVIKSNAYGHGLVPVARAVVDAGAEWLAVITTEEALELRQADVELPILIPGVVPPSNWPFLAEHDIRITVTDEEQAAALERYRGQPLKVHLKVETGLGRLGFPPDAVGALLHRIEHNEQVQIEGIASHFASVEEQDVDYTRRQLAEFDRAVSYTRSKLLRHIAATAAILQLPESHYDMVRAGIGIYGLWPSDDVRQAVQANDPTIELAPALAYRAKLVQVKTVSVGSTIGYGRTYKVNDQTRVGVVPVGYAEGYDRALSNRAHMLVRGMRCQVLGRVAMNMCMIDLSDAPNATAGDIVTLIGRDGQEAVTADDLAGWADTINYEIVARIPVSIHRKYLNR